MDRLLIPVIGIERLRMQTDGTGVRTLIGTHGCPLRCQYCLNPQSWNGTKKPTLYTPEQLFQKVFIDNIYFQATNGGITIGGGEPLLYIDALSQFVDMCPNNWNLWIETALNVSCDSVIQASNLFDHFLIDIKTTIAIGEAVAIVFYSLFVKIFFASSILICAFLPFLCNKASK